MKRRWFKGSSENYGKESPTLKRHYTDYLIRHAAQEQSAASTNSLNNGANTEREVSPLFLLTMVLAVGFCGGMTAVVYRYLLEIAFWARGFISGTAIRYGGWGTALLVAVMGGLGASAGIITMWAPETSGSGIPHIKAVMLGRARLRAVRVLLVKLTGGFVAALAGFSLGREGPTIQMGSAVAKAVCRLFRQLLTTIHGPYRSGRTPWKGFSKELRLRERDFVALGAAAGLTGAFNAPLSGIIFVIEELEVSLTRHGVVRVSLACILAALLYRAIFGHHPVLPYNLEAQLDVALWPLLVLVGFLSGIAGALFNLVLDRSLAVVDGTRSRVRPWVPPFSIGCLAGVITPGLPEVLGGGHHLIESVLEAPPLFVPVMLLFAAKFFFTVVSYASGVPGGIFFPLLSLGALLGVAVWRAAFSLALAPPELYGVLAVAGMASLLAGCTRAFFTSIVLLIEMTGAPACLFPVLLACTVSYVTACALNSPPVYEMLLARRWRVKETVEAGAPEAGNPEEDLPATAAGA